jgi:hypothetical protein
MQCTRVPRRRVASLVSAIVIAAAIPAAADVVVGRDARTAADIVATAFDVPVPAGGETVLRYRIQVGG